MPGFSKDGTDWHEQFPDLQPIESLPVNWNLFGFGLGLFGSGRPDRETSTFVMTQCISALGIPIFAWAAYRYAIASDGVYVLGRQPLSRFATVWNYLIVGCLVGIGGTYLWTSYTSSPEYIAARTLSEAHGLLESGELPKAARLYRDVAVGKSGRAVAARQAFLSLLNEPLRKASPAQAAETLQVAVQMEPQAKEWLNSNDLVKLGTELSEKLAASDQRGALAILDAIEPLEKNAGDINSKRQHLLELITQKEPDDPEAASQLALIYEAKAKPQECERLLAPHRGRLGVREGARILGRIYARRGDHDQAVALLLPYAEGRLKKLHAAEQAVSDSVKDLQKRTVEEIKSRKTPPGFYQRLENANEADQQALIQEYFNTKLKDDPEFGRRQRELIREAAVVPVALDLGIALLQRAQRIPEPAKRRAELKKSEGVFLAVRGIAGESNEYRLFLGQVYYWLGKEKEGRELFDSLLNSNHRNFELLMSVSSTLRDIGSSAESRALSEEAYTKTGEQRKKFAAAHLRALTSTNLDDEIVWLGRSDRSNPQAKADLAKAMADQAMRDGKDDLANTRIREAISIYAAQPETDASLNNEGLLWFSLYHLTGDAAALESGTAKIERALALNPSDSILMLNAANSILEGAIRKIIGDSIDLRLLKTSGQLELLSYLYADQAGRQQYVERVRTSPGVAKALSYFEKGLVLAPKRAATYQTIASIHRYTRNVTALRDLLVRIEHSDPDVSDTIRETREYYAGKKDDIYRKTLDAELSRCEARLAPAKAKGGATYALAAISLIDEWHAAHTLDKPVDANRALALAEDAYAAAPSERTQTTLVNALCFNANRTLAEKDAAYAKMLSKSKRSLSDRYLIAVALSREAPLRDAVLANPSFKRAAALLVEWFAKCPEDCGTCDWAVLRAARPETAHRLAQSIKRDEILPVIVQINMRLSPASGATVLQAYFASQMAGNEVAAKNILSQSASQGVPLPFEIK